MHKTQNSFKRFKTAFLAALCCASFSPAIAHAQDITTGLVAHWTFDQGSGGTITDESGNGNDGTWLDGVNDDVNEETVSGALGQGVRLTANTYMTAASAFPTGASAPYSVSLWINPYGLGSAGQSKIWSAGPASPTCQNGPKLRKIFDGGDYRFETDNQCSGSPQTAGFVYDNNWYHVVVTYNGSNIYIYINGALNNTAASNYSGTDPSAANFLLGGTGGETILADIDDVRIYNRALTAEDIAKLRQLASGNMIFNSDNDTIQYFDNDSWIAAGPPKYKPNAVEFDGSTFIVDNTWAGSPPINVSGSFWFKRDTDNLGISQVIIHNREISDPYFRVRFNTSNQLVIDGRETVSNNFSQLLGSSSSITDGEWHHALFSVDSTNRSLDQLYIDDVDVTNSQATTFTAFGGGEQVSIGAFGSSTATGSEFNYGSLADVWVNFNTKIDFSAQTNRRAFIDASGNPVDLGEDGSKPTGSAPDIFLSGDTDDWHTNKGTGGGFTENGALTTAPSPREDNYTWQQIGNSYDAPGVGDTSIAVLSPNSIAIFHDNNTTGGSLSKAVFDGTNFTQVGNTLIVGGNNNTISELDNDTIVLANGSLTAYFFNGSDWVQVGNSSVGPGEHVTTLSENRIAAGAANSLRTFTWDGTNFTPVGNSRTIINLGRGNLVGLSENRVAAVSQSNGIQAYEFDGTDWTELGNPLPVTLGRTGGTSFDENTLVVTGASLDLTTYRFNGSDWLPYGQTLDITGNEIGAAVISHNTVAINRAGGPLNAFGFAYCSAPAKPQGTIIYESVNNQMQYCDGENWVPMGPPGDGGGGCADPVGATGDITYNTTYDLMQYCEGDTWIPIGQAADPCDPDFPPTSGTTCRDGSIYVGLSPDGNVPMYTTPADQSNNARWGTSSFTTGATSLITGEENSATVYDDVIAGNGTSNGNPNIFRICVELSAHGHDDWYVPAVNELGVLRSNRNAGALNGTFNISGFPDSFYWSSSEFADTRARGTDFNTGTISQPAKGADYNIRCVRKD